MIARYVHILHTRHLVVSTQGLLALKKLYVPRTLLIGDQLVSEVDVLPTAGTALILSEPGAGKTSLLNSLAARFGVVRTPASIFVGSQAACVVVDAFDEVARIDLSGIRQTLLALRRAAATRTILSSRSGEWDEAHTLLIRDILGFEPVIARLVPLTEEEQQQLFQDWHPDADFSAFVTGAILLDLAPLLGNPEFLRLFSDAFVHAGGVLKSRHTIFSDATEYLARETNPAIPGKDAPSPRQRSKWAGEVFARLLLSGSGGVATSHPAEGPTFPILTDMGLDEGRLNAIIDTRLFRPAAGANRHEPVHRIVAEYCAAEALVARIMDPKNRFSMRQCLALVAPNGAARDDLRGLLGWMAALGNQEIQDLAIDADPYAVISNGDPSMMTPRSRHRLLDSLRQLEATDPFFRRADRWRSFSASGFFTPHITDAITPILAQNDDGHLRGLLLELLKGSPAVSTLKPQLRAIILDERASRGSRHSALECILGEAADISYFADLIDLLIVSGTIGSLHLAATIVSHVGANNLALPQILQLLLACSAIYPMESARPKRDIGSRYFIRVLVRGFDTDTTAWLLDEITRGLSCTCGKKRWDCYCRTGRSKIAGHLLDRYFDITPGPYEPGRTWNWLRGLNFHRQTNTKDSSAVRVLAEDHLLRRAIHLLMFEGMTTRDQIIEAQMDRQGHSGAGIWQDDVRPLIDHAFDTDNVELWFWFVPSHRYCAKLDEQGPIPLRKYARQQASLKPAFLARWAIWKRQQAKNWEEQRARRYRFQSRQRRKEQAGEAAALISLKKHKALIEAGNHRGWLARIARYYLIQPADMNELTHELIDVEVALRSSLQTIKHRVPTPAEYAIGDSRDLVRTLHAGCVAEFRAVGDLSNIDRQILAAIWPDIGGYNGVEDEERERFESLIESILFSTEAEADAYISAYIEPQLASGIASTDVTLLERKSQFKFLLTTRPLEWLQRFPSISLNTLDNLFGMAVRYCERGPLLDLIGRRCSELDSGILPHALEAQRRFWFLRHFWFLDGDQSAIWTSLDRSPDLIFELSELRSALREPGSSWPALKAEKIELILDTFAERWPAVPLPSSHGTGSPKEEDAYRYLSDLIFAIGRDEPEAALPVLERLIVDPRMATFERALRSIREGTRRAAALADFRPPSAFEVGQSLDQGKPANVAQMRRIMIEFLEKLQIDVRGGDLDLLRQFYDAEKRVDENTATKVILNWLRPRLEPLGFMDVVEHQLADENRCDITATIFVDGIRRMLVTEVKGQWNRSLFTAAEAQLDERYAIHPSAERQGIYLVLWFGPDEKIAGLKNSAGSNATELLALINEKLPEDLKGRIDVFMLDLSRPVRP